MRLIESFRNWMNPLPSGEEFSIHRKRGGSVILRFGEEPPINITTKTDEMLFQELEAPGGNLNDAVVKITQELNSLFESKKGRDLTVIFLDAEHRVVREYKGKPKFKG